MEAAGLWRAMLLLVLWSSGTVNHPAPYRVKGIRGGSVSLPVLISPSKRVAKIQWQFHPPTGSALVIAKFQNGEMERSNLSDRFGQRLEMVDEATLRIIELELGDCGIYVARVRLASMFIEEHSFSCMVYGPVPEPRIRHQVISRTAEGCNVTLQCLVSGEGPFNISWKRGDQLNVLEEGSDWYRLSPEGTELHLSWRPDSSDSTLTCLLSNPVDQRNASFDLPSVCPSESQSDEDSSVNLSETWTWGASGCLSWVRVAMLTGVLVQILAVASVNILERTGQRQD